MRTVFIFFIVAFGFSWAASYFTTMPELPLSIEAEKGKRLPVALEYSLPANKAHALILTLPASGSRQRNAINTTFYGGNVTLSSEDTTWSLSPTSPHCTKEDDGGISCRIPWRRTNIGVSDLRLVSLGQEIRVDRFTVDLLSTKRASRLGFVDINIIGLLIFGAIPIVWLLHRRYKMSQWFIISVATTGLMMIQPIFTIILLIFLYAMYQSGHLLINRESKKLGLLASLITCSIAFLLTFKFGLPVIDEIFANVGGFNLALPLGLSYFVVRLIDTQLTWFRGQATDISFREYLCFMIFPPTLAAGPIETIQNFPKIRLKSIQVNDVVDGGVRIAIGFAKKLFIADYLLAGIVDEYFFIVGLDPSAASGLSVAILLFSSVIFAYLDFSAYSDIAIGLGRLYGYRLSENFNFPILQGNLRDYWQNWHMTLSDWGKRNIYVPTAIATRNPYLPIFCTMITISLWHNPGLSWFTWAVHHSIGLGLITFIEKKRGKPSREWLLYARPIRTLLTLSFVALSHSFILFSDYPTALQCYLRAWSLLIGNW